MKTKDPFKELTGLTKKEYAKQKKRQDRERIIILHEFSKGKDEKIIAEDFNIQHKQVNKEIEEYVRFSMPRFGVKNGDDVMKSMAKYVAPFIEKGKVSTPKKQGLSRTWDSKTKRWVYYYTNRIKKAKKQPDTKLSQREEWLLTGKYKVRNNPKEVRKLGKAVIKGLKKTNKATKKVKVKSKKKKRTKTKLQQRTLFGE